MSEPTTSNGSAPNAASEPRFWKQAISSGIAAGIGGVISLTVVGIFAAIEGILRGTLPQWLHLIEMNWLLTVCALTVIFLLGFIVGVSYATVGVIYVFGLMLASIFHQAKPKREWWLTPIDWIAIVGVWIGVAVLFAKENAIAKVKANRKEGLGTEQSSTNEAERLRAESEQQRAEIERLRAENEQLRAQAPKTPEGQLSLRARVLPPTMPTTTPADNPGRS